MKTFKQFTEQAKNDVPNIIKSLQSISTKASKEINPEKRIISTKDVDPQQNLKSFDAINHRLELMKERKYLKQNFNVREINLCEH